MRALFYSTHSNYAMRAGRGVTPVYQAKRDVCLFAPTVWFRRLSLHEYRRDAPRSKFVEGGIMSNVGRGVTSLAALLILGSTCARAAADGPDATVRRAYAVTIHELADLKNGVPPWRPPYRDQLMSKRLAGLFARDDQYMDESGDMGNVDADPFISGQAGGVKNLKVTIGSQNGDKATVYADFRSLGHPVRVTFDMARENGRWVIDDITDAVDKQPYRIVDLLSQPYDCGSFMDKPCKR